MDDTAFIRTEVGKDYLFLEVNGSLSGVVGQLAESVFTTFLIVIHIEMEFRPKGESLKEDEREDHSYGR